MNNLPTLFIVGGESVSLEIRETAELLREHYLEIYNVIPNGEKCIYSYVQDGELDLKLKDINEIRYIVGFSKLTLKKVFYDLFNKYNGQLENVIHPNAYLSPKAVLGKGNYIGCNSVISTCARIGNNNIINYNVTIGHDVVLGNDCVLNPGCRISGRDIIGDNCLIGSNAFIFQGVSIHSGCKIDALTYIRKSITEPSICFGSPSPKKYDIIL